MDGVVAMARQVIIRGWWWLGVFAVAWSALLILPVTRLVYAPVDVQIDGDTVRVFRTFPGDRIGLPRPRISYVETVQPLTADHNGGRVCRDTGGPFVYSQTAPVGSWTIPWAETCLDDPSGFVWTAEWTWHIGELRVGPTSLTTRVLRDPCQYRISSRGIIHGPDSPYWSATSADNCYPTRASAEAALEDTQ